jgi:methionyl-tRNA synthetase
MKTFYITTTLPYVNADPHIGFAMEIIRADIIARYKKLEGFDVFFNTGTDEHGLKIYRKAEEQGIDPQKYVDGYAEKFKQLKSLLNLSEDIHFIRTTDAHHKTAAQEFWKICDKNGYIYKKNYQIKYCVGCELEKTESELINGRCILHPNLEIELIDEENYFFKLSEFQQKLLKFYERNPDFVIPDSRYNEIKAFVGRGSEDFSISRLKEKMPWGVPVPDDDTQVMYVWFDALVNYISTLGWPQDLENFKKYWEEGTPVQYCGKDNLRQQSAMWQAMLMAADLPNTHQIVINGFITSGGQKMSKSIGNVVNPVDVVSEYSADALRYFVARELSTFEDSDFTLERFKEAYNTALANGLGNLVSRVMKMAETNLDEVVYLGKFKLPQNFKDAIEKFNIQAAVNIVWQKIQDTDRKIQETQPFKLVKDNPKEAKKIITGLVVAIDEIAEMLTTVMPETAEKIKTAVKNNKMPEKPLFARKD